MTRNELIYNDKNLILPKNADAYKSDTHCVEYNCVEQYIMAQKAILFNDSVNYQKIMLSKLPNVRNAF